MKWDGRYVAGVSKVSALKRTTEVVKHRDGGDPSTSRKSPGRTEFEAVTLERGVTHDPEFEQWAEQGVEPRRRASASRCRWPTSARTSSSSCSTRPARSCSRYRLFRCWVSEFQALPELDANANAVAIQHIKLENEGWERDYAVVEPSEPTFTEP